MSLLTLCRTAWLLVLVVGCLAGFAPAPASAQTLNITLDPPNIAGNPGDPAFQVQSTLENPAINPTLFITGSTLNVAGTGIVSNNAQFLLNAPASLAPGATAGPFNAFTVTLTGAAVPGVYVGTFTILGGTNPGDLNNIGTVNFTVTVLGGGGGGSSVPEGQAWQIFALAVPALYLARRRTAHPGDPERGSEAGAGSRERMHGDGTESGSNGYGGGEA